MSEQLRLEDRFRNRRAIDSYQRHVALLAAIVNRPSDELLTGAGLARHEHCGLRVGDAVDPIDDRAHRRTAADDAIVVELLVALAAEVPAFRAQALVVERAPHRREQLVDFERLAQIVERAQLHRVDRAVDGRVRRHQDDVRRVGRRADVLADELEAAHARHHVVGEQDVEGPLAEQLQRLTSAGRVDDFVAVAPQRAAQRLAQLLFVVDEQQHPLPPHHRRPRRPPATAAAATDGAAGSARSSASATAASNRSMIELRWLRVCSFRQSAPRRTCSGDRQPRALRRRYQL